MANLKENKISSEIIYQGRLLDVRRDEVCLPNGNISIREWIKHPGAVCMIPRLPDNRIALIRQYRYPVQQVMIELPAGKLDENENPVIVGTSPVINYSARISFDSISPGKYAIQFFHDENENQKMDFSLIGIPGE